MGLPDFITRLHEEARAKAQRIATDEEYRKKIRATQEIASTFSPTERINKIQALVEQSKQTAESKIESQKQEQKAQIEPKKTDYVPPTSSPLESTTISSVQSSVSLNQEPKKSKTLLYVGIGVSVLVLVATTVVFLRKKRS